MFEITWSGYNWLMQERWGLVHPQKSHWWYDPNMVYVDDNEFLHLRTGYNPRYFEHLDKTSNIGVGLVSCTSKFTYGNYEICAKLPYGRNLWPAFWMWSWASWPPEIDVFEGFSDKNANFNEGTSSKKSILLDFLFKKANPAKPYNLKSNVHYILDNFNDSLESKKIFCHKPDSFVFKGDPTTQFITYTLQWFPDEIKIQYNGVTMLLLSSNYSPEHKKVLDSLKNHEMNVILNNGVTSFVNINKPPESDFIIQYFKYSPLMS